jgi:uncharacterized membrane protein YvbJ
MKGREDYMAFCSNCGKEFIGDPDMCVNCGVVLKKEKHSRIMRRNTTHLKPMRRNIMRRISAATVPATAVSAATISATTVSAAAVS